MKKSDRAATSQDPGFTIVELLIVIVVIAILAAIALVAYNGIQDRAKAARKDSDIASIKKKLEAYRITNSDQYPASASAALTSPDFGGFNATTVTAPSSYGCGSAEGLTKDKYCLFSSTSGSSRYALWWWDDDDDVWRWEYKNVNGYEDSTTLGSGLEPDGIPG